MIRFQELQLSKNWKRRHPAGKVGSSSLSQAFLDPSNTDDPTTAPKIVNKVTHGARIHSLDANLLVQDLHSILFPFVSGVRAQSGLVVPLKTVTFKSEETNRRRSRQKLRVDRIVTYEIFGHSLSNFIEGSEAGKIHIKDISSFANYVFRLLKLLEVRGLIAPEITPSQLVYDRRPAFNLTDLFDRPLYDVREINLPSGATVTSSLSHFRDTLNRSDTERKQKDWQENEIHSLCLTFVQVATKKRQKALDQMRKEDKKENILRTVRNLLNSSSSRGSKYTEAFIALLSGLPIEIVAKQINLSFDSFGQYKRRALAREAIAKANMTILSDEFTKKTYISSISNTNLHALKAGYEEYLKHVAWTLKQFKYSGSGFGWGGKLRDMMNEIGQMSYPGILTSVDFDWTELDQYLNTSLRIAADGLIQVPYLTQLAFNFSGLHLRREGSLSLIDILQNSNKLTHFKLVLNNTTLWEEALPPLCHALGNLPLIELELQFQHINVSDPVLNILSEVIASKKKLRALSIFFDRNKMISDEAVSRFNETVSNLPSLNKLGLSFSYCQSLTDNIVTTFAPSSLFMSNLELSFHWTNFTSVGLVKIASALKNLRYLSSFSLDLGYTQISNDGLSEIIDVLSNAYYLSQIKLSVQSCNGVNDTSVMKLAEMYRSHQKIKEVLTNLKGLKLSDNGKQIFKDLESLTTKFTRFEALL